MPKFHITAIIKKRSRNNNGSIINQHTWSCRKVIRQTEDAFGETGIISVFPSVPGDACSSSTACALADMNDRAFVVSYLPTPHRSSLTFAQISLFQRHVSTAPVKRFLIRQKYPKIAYFYHVLRCRIIITSQIVQSVFQLRLELRDLGLAAT